MSHLARLVIRAIKEYRIRPLDADTVELMAELEHEAKQELKQKRKSADGTI